MTDIADYTHYVSTPFTETKLQFKCITDNDTQRAIDKLENKSSCGHDGIFNKLLRLLKIELSSSLTLIINQIITTGIFLDSFNISNITPLSKKKVTFLCYQSTDQFHFYQQSQRFLKYFFLYSQSSLQLYNEMLSTISTFL